MNKSIAQRVLIAQYHTHQANRPSNLHSKTVIIPFPPPISVPLANDRSVYVHSLTRFRSPYLPSCLLPNDSLPSLPSLSSPEALLPQPSLARLNKPIEFEMWI